MTDPGDATQRNFRYQHAYGVVLIAASKRGVKPYVAIWCEQHEDLLAERTDGRFDGYQIKTARPEGGAWTMSNGELVKSVGRFVDLVREFGDKIAELFFVSNTAVDEVTPDSRDDRKRGRCPRLFLEHVRACASPTSLAAPYDATFRALLAECGCGSEPLFGTLRRLQVILGPSRSDFDAVLAHEHIGTLPECSRLAPPDLNRLRDELTALVCRASSLHVTDPVRHLRPPLSGSGVDPILAAKRIAIADVVLSPTQAEPGTFQFPGAATIGLGLPRPASVVHQKLERGGIEPDIIADIAGKERAAESHLMEDAVRRPESHPKLLRQLESMVLGECREAYLRVRLQDTTFGRQMLIDVQDRLRRLATERPHMVGRQEYECLLGIASMLTGECRVWWSDRFPIEEDAA